MASRILDLDTSWRWMVCFTRPDRFIPGGRAAGVHWIGAWADLRTGLNDLEIETFCPYLPSSPQLVAIPTALFRFQHIQDHFQSTYPAYFENDIGRIITERSTGVVGASASCSVGPGFKSQPWVFTLLSFLRFFSAPIVECWGSALERRWPFSSTPFSLSYKFMVRNPWF
jgi:hypothetical protein